VGSNPTLSAILFLTGLAVTSTACCPPPSEAETVVLSMFDAYRRGDQAAVQALIAPGALNVVDSDGNDTGRRLCEGIAMRCLVSNYYEYESGANRGDLISREAKCHGCGMSSDRGVLLRTVWSPARMAGRKTVCQEFTVRAIRGNEYRVSFFHPPKSCD